MLFGAIIWIFKEEEKNIRTTNQEYCTASAKSFGLHALKLNNSQRFETLKYHISQCKSTIIQGLIKLCDFGWSISSKTMRETFCGTPLYVSPELLKRKNYNNKIDVWSVGILTY